MPFQEHISLRNLITLKTGGEARYFFEARTPKDITEGVSFAKAKELPIFVLGEGSNTLVSEKGFPGLVIKMSLQGTEWTEQEGEVYVKVAAGENWDAFVEETVTRGFYGLENLSGIPGTVGAAPVQNIGAYGAEVKNVIESVFVFDTNTQKEKILSNIECQFGYRESIFKKKEGESLIITHVLFRLSKNGTFDTGYKDLSRYFSEKDVPPTLQNLRKAVLEIRKGKFPDLRAVGTAGSFFKNLILSQKEFENISHLYPDMPHFEIPDKKVKVPLAWILDFVLHLKGYREGDVGLYEKQPIVLVNFGHASSDDVYKFASRIQSRIKEEIGVAPEFEVRCIGDFS